MDAVACETSFDCGDLKCIDQVCRDPFAPVRHAPNMTVSHRLMVGTGEGYGLLVALLDIAAAGVSPLLLAEASAHSGPVQTAFGILCFVPVGLTGSITHFAHARVIPGIVSFFAWTSGAALTFSVGGLSGFTSGRFSDTNAWAMGLAFGSIAAASLTALDVWMARSVVPKRTSSFVVAPSIMPVRDGALGALAGTF